MEIGDEDEDEDEDGWGWMGMNGEYRKRDNILAFTDLQVTRARTGWCLNEISLLLSVYLTTTWWPHPG